MRRTGATRVTTKGQIVIPKDTRARLGWKPGTRLQVEEAGRSVTLRPLEGDEFEQWLEELEGCLGRGDPLKELEADHREEIRKDEKHLARLLGGHRLPAR